MNVTNILTVDLEDWYHICGVRELIPEESWCRFESRVVQGADRILDILSANSVTATFFVLGFVAEQYPALIRKIKSAGHEIALHGYAHQRVYTLTPDAFRSDLEKALHVIKGTVDVAIKGYRAPEWSIRDDSLWALEILKQFGFLYDSSMAPLPFVGNPQYPKTPYKKDLQDGRLWEIPPLVAPTFFGNLPIGGGWGLRSFPYGLIRRRIQALNRQDQPATVFLHPREFVRDVPRLSGLPLAKRFVVGAKIVTTEKRLKRLLRDFSFGPVTDYLTAREGV
jgi:polysaccharide deacetylase family protein (PEP-CTERM system associated)